MSELPGTDFFAPPPFNPEAAMQQLVRGLRDLRSLSERGNSFELRGMAVVRLEALNGHITAEIARTPARTPQWDARWLKSAADVRSFLDEVRRRLARWSDE
jgi:hypothetical protein